MGEYPFEASDVIRENSGGGRGEYTSHVGDLIVPGSDFGRKGTFVDLAVARICCNVGSVARSAAEEHRRDKLIQIRHARSPSSKATSACPGSASAAPCSPVRPQPSSADLATITRLEMLAFRLGCAPSLFVAATDPTG